MILGSCTTILNYIRFESHVLSYCTTTTIHLIISNKFIKHDFERWSLDRKKNNLLQFVDHQLLKLPVNKLLTSVYTFSNVWSKSKMNCKAECPIYCKKELSINVWSYWTVKEKKKKHQDQINWILYKKNSKYP